MTKTTPNEGFHPTAQYMKHPGDAIGPYLVRNWLGAGVEGAVFKVLCLKSSAMCTVKLLRGRGMVPQAEHTASYYRKLAGISAVKQFREWGVLRHQAGVGERPWLAFDFVPGETLPDYVKKSSRVSLAMLMLDLCNLVAEVHTRGVGVGDLDHGRNVIVEERTGRLVLCDADAGVAGAMNHDKLGDLDELAALCVLMHRWRKEPVDVELMKLFSSSRSVKAAARRLRARLSSGTGGDAQARAPPR